MAILYKRLGNFGLLIFILSLVLASCKKENNPKTVNEILTNNKWKHIQTRKTQKNLNTGIVVSDSTYTTQACEQNSIFIFYADSRLLRNYECSSPVVFLESTWRVENDSTFNASIFVRHTSGIRMNLGIPLGKLINISDNNLQILCRETFTNGSSEITEFSDTYYLQAVQ